MLSLLPDTISILSRSANQKVSSLVRDMKLEKSDIQKLISSISKYASTSDYIAARVSPFSLIEKQPLVELFRDSYLRMRQLYSVANSVGFLANSMTSLFSSEIKKVEKDIDDLKLFIDNYEFIAGKDDYYNSNYIEKFDNYLGSMRYDSITFPIPDRDNISFDENGNGFIDSDLGIFKMGNKFFTKNVLDKISNISIQTNYSEFSTTATSFENVLNDSLTNPWSSTIKSPVIINSKLSNYEDLIGYRIATISGAQAAVEVVLDSPVVMDTIRISPNYSLGMSILQIVVYVTDETVSEEQNEERIIRVLNQPKDIESTTEFSFSKSSVNKIVFIFNQRTYKRGSLEPIVSEVNSKAIQSFVDKRNLERRNKFSYIQDVVYFWFKKKTNINELRNNSSQDYEYYSYRFPQDPSEYLNQIRNEIYMANNYDYEDRPVFHDSPIFLDLVTSIMEHLDSNATLIGSDVFVETQNNRTGINLISESGLMVRRNSNNNYPLRRQFYNPPITGKTGEELLRSMVDKEKSEYYEYSFSIDKIEFLETDSTSVNKASFVSKRLNFDGQPSAVKCKVQSINVSDLSVPDTYDLKDYISYELSFSTSERPDEESDWLPIVPWNYERINSELVFFDVSNFVSYTRFYGVASSMQLFKDGILCPESSFSYSESQKKILLIDTSLYSPESIFVVSYDLNFSDYDPYEIDMIRYNIFVDSKKRYSTSSGVGQRFTRSGSDRSVRLDYMPYISRAYSRSSFYSYGTGTIFNGSGQGYSPVSIRLSDGSYAINLTNYTDSPERVQFPTDNQIYFIQSGKQIVFNRQITSEFTVDYEYVPENLRFRLIARKNISNLDIPVKIDSVLIKAKTVKYDHFYDTLNYISLSNR